MFLVQAVGPQEAECDGAQFQNDANVITIETWPTSTFLGFLRFRVLGQCLRSCIAKPGYLQSLGCKKKGSGVRRHDLIGDLMGQGWGFDGVGKAFGLWGSGLGSSLCSPSLQGVRV